MGISDWLKNRFGNPSLQPTREQLPPDSNSSLQPTPEQLPPDSDLSLPAIPQQIQPDSNFSLPTTEAEIKDYQEAFEQALRFTQSLGYDTTSLSLGDVGTDLLDFQGKFDKPVFKEAGIHRVKNQKGIIDRTQSAGQCLKWSHFLQPLFEKHLGKRVMLTVGQLWRDHECGWGQTLTFEQVRRWNQTGIQNADLSRRGGLMLHAWLTLESGEIIDPTILSFLAQFDTEVYGTYAGKNLWGREPFVIAGKKFRYVPVTVGREIIEHIVSRTTIPERANFLASKLSDLEPVVSISLDDLFALLKNDRL